MIRFSLRALVRKVLWGHVLQGSRRPIRRSSVRPYLDALENRTATSTFHGEAPGLLPPPASDIAIVEREAVVVEAPVDAGGGFERGADLPEHDDPGDFDPGYGDPEHDDAASDKVPDDVLEPPSTAPSDLPEILGESDRTGISDSSNPFGKGSRPEPNLPGNDSDSDGLRAADPAGQRASSATRTMVPEVEGQGGWRNSAAHAGPASKFDFGSTDQASQSHIADIAARLNLARSREDVFFRAEISTDEIVSPKRPAGTASLPTSRTDLPLSATDLPDGSLLQRYAAHREETAFAILVQRHERLVFGVCQRVLGDSHAALDAFQATFLVLARRAGGLNKDGSVAGWLYKVAYHLALRLRAITARQRRREQDAARSSEVMNEGFLEIDKQEMQDALSEELERLPDKYRVPLVLCYFDGRTHDEAARAIGVPRGSMAKRIGEGLERLRERLTDRGFML